MTLATQHIPMTFVPSPDRVRRFTVDEYHKLIRDGTFDDEEPVELLEGWIVYQMGHNPPHDVAVKLVSKWLDRALPDRTHTRTQSAITLSDSEPLPDVVVVNGVERDYTQRHPVPSDIVIAIEISDSTLDQDRKVKAPMYARAGIPVFWIVNLPDRVVEVYANPSGGAYPPPVRFGPDDSVPLSAGGQTLAPVPVSEIMP